MDNGNGEGRTFEYVEGHGIDKGLLGAMLGMSWVAGALCARTMNQEQMAAIAEDLDATFDMYIKEEDKGIVEVTRLLVLDFTRDTIRHLADQLGDDLPLMTVHDTDDDEPPDVSRKGAKLIGKVKYIPLIDYLARLADKLSD